MAQKITIPNVRFSYAHVFQPYAFEGDTKEPKYSVTILIPKTATDTVAKIKAAIKAAEKAYKALTAAQKKYVSKATKNRLKKVKAALAKLK